MSPLLRLPMLKNENEETQGLLSSPFLLSSFLPSDYILFCTIEDTGRRRVKVACVTKDGRVILSPFFLSPFFSFFLLLRPFLPMKRVGKGVDRNGKRVRILFPFSPLPSPPPPPPRFVPRSKKQRFTAALRTGDFSLFFSLYLSPFFQIALGRT